LIGGQIISTVAMEVQLALCLADVQIMDPKIILLVRARIFVPLGVQKFSLTEFETSIAMEVQPALCLADVQIMDPKIILLVRARIFVSLGVQKFSLTEFETSTV
jgi:hypothetical protein